MTRSALVLIDIQNDYFDGGKMVLEGSLQASEKAGKILAAFREKELLRIHVQHLSTRPGATFFLPETEGVQIHANVKPQENELLVVKHFPNSFRDTPLLEHLQRERIEQVIVAGMMTHMCVEATTRAAFDYGFQCTVLHDACATRALSFGGAVVPAQQVHAAFLAALNGIYATVVGTDEYLSSLG